MRLGAIPENPIEWALLKAGQLPTPLLDTLVGMLLVRTILVGVKFGVFEALAAGPLAPAEAAGRIGADARATQKLLNALVGAKYLQYVDGRYALSPVSRKWLLPDSDPSLHDSILFRFLEWDLVEGFDEFLRTGKPLDVHENFTSDEEWNLYQRGMRSNAGVGAAEVARRTPVREGATAMLDIGGSHGYFSVALCRRHPALRATILDLPSAVKEAAPILARENMGDRVVHRAGNALTDDLGENAWDLVFISHLVHHFDEETNRELAKRAARALKPGGALVIQEIIRPHSPNDAGQMGALMDFYFALTSLSGTWSVEEIADWQKGAGLTPQRPIVLRTGPGVMLQAGIKP